jgi:hypothetical protein
MSRAHLLRVPAVACSSRVYVMFVVVPGVHGCERGTPWLQMNAVPMLCVYSNSILQSSPALLPVQIPAWLQRIHNVCFGAQQFLGHTAYAVCSGLHHVMLLRRHGASPAADTRRVISRVRILEPGRSDKVQACKCTRFAEHVSGNHLLAKDPTGYPLNHCTYGLGMCASSSNEELSGTKARTAGEYGLLSPRGLSGRRPFCRSR